MKPAFPLDEGLPKRCAPVLRAGGFEAWHVTELGLRSAGDPQVLDAARERGAVLVCHDSDFAQLLALSGEVAPSVMVLRVSGVAFDAMAALIVRSAEGMSEILAAGAVLSVTHDAVRARRLPLRTPPAAED